MAILNQLSANKDRYRLIKETNLNRYEREKNKLKGRYIKLHDCYMNDLGYFVCPYYRITDAIHLNGDDFVENQTYELYFSELDFLFYAEPEDNRFIIKRYSLPYYSHDSYSNIRSYNFEFAGQSEMFMELAEFAKEKEGKEYLEKQQMQSSIDSFMIDQEKIKKQNDELMHRMSELLGRLDTLENPITEEEKAGVREIISGLPVPIKQLSKRQKIKLLAQIGKKMGKEFAIRVADVYGMGWLVRWVDDFISKDR